MSKNYIVLTALMAACLLVVAFVCTRPAPVSHPLQLRVLGQTNDASGSPMTIVGVTNNTGQARLFYFSSIVPCPDGWTSANQRCQKTGRLMAHSDCEVLLLPPKGEARWKFSCMSVADVTKPEWLWYRFVGRTGLTWLGFRDQPRRSYVSTAELRQ